MSEKWRTVIVIATGSFMVVLDTTIVNIALPHIITVFGSTVNQAQLVLTSYLLALATIMPATPYLSFTFGSKRLYILTQIMFTLGSMLCGVSWSVASLSAARVLQGLGGGMIQPLGMGMLFRVTPPQELGKVMAIYALPVMVAPILGPTLGGYLVEYVDWRWVFFLNVPVGLLGCLLGMVLLKETPTVKGQRFDLLGAVLATVASSSALLALTDAPTQGWGDTGVVLKLLLSAITFPAFVWHQLRTPHPLLNLRLFAIPAFSLGALLNFATTMSLFGAIFLLPVFLQNLRGMGAMETGLLLFPQAVGITISSQVGGRLYDRFGPRPVISAGLVLLAAATWELGKLDLTTPDSSLRILLVLRGFSMGFVMMPAMTAWMTAAPQSQSQAASALNNVLRQLFGAFSTALFASLLQNRVSFHYATLAMFVNNSSLPVTQALAQAQQFALAHGMNLGQAQSLTVAQLAGQVAQAASVRAFDDAFIVAAAGCVAALGPAWFMRKAASARGGGAAHAVAD